MRKRAPGSPETHPDWVVSLSGGINSAAAALLVIDAIKADKSGGNFGKKPFAIYMDTRVGIPLNRLYVEQLCDWLGIQLWTLRTDESFLEWLRRDGAPGPGAHGNVKNELKGRQSSLLTSKLDNPFFVLGISAYESDDRAELPKINEKRRHVEVYPVHRLSAKRQAEIILRSQCPINPIWTHPDVIQDCGCFALGDPSEVDATIDLFPEFGQRLREWEESITHDGLKGNLGWGGLTAIKKSAIESGGEQLSICIDGCQRKREPRVMKALRHRVEGGSVNESVSILYEENPVVMG